MQINSKTNISTPVAWIGPATSLEPTRHNVEQFHSLLVGVRDALNGGTPQLVGRSAKQTPLQGSPLEEAAFTVAKAERSINALEVEIRKAVDRSQSPENLNSDTVKSLVYQQTVSAFNHSTLVTLGNKASDIGEEVSSLTKGR